MSETRYRPEELAGFAEALFAAAGLDAGKARTVAELLVEADLMGHTTHGLALAAPYLGDVEKGGMAATGEPGVVRDKGACLTWDGRRLPGVWLAARAVDEAVGRAERLGTGTVVVRNAHHIACSPRSSPAPPTRDDGDPREFGPFGGERGAVRWDPRRVHPEPDRGGHPDGG
jgi:LDH2 family malate/lactate/ureidoglycolate dehydrogenase